MGTLTQYVVRLCVLYTITVVCARCSTEFFESNEIVETLDSILAKNNKILKKPVQVDAEWWIWQDYKNESGFGNQEELLITNIEIWQDLNLPENIDNWQCLKHDGDIYFAGTNESSLFLYRFNAEYNSASFFANISTFGSIETFKMISLTSPSEMTSRKSDIYVILSVKISNEIYLKWYRLINTKLITMWIWKLGKSIKNVEYFSVNGRQKLLLLYENDVYFSHSYSAVEIYDIKINGYFSTLRLCQQLFVPSASYAEVCVSRHDKTIISLISSDNLIVYEYTDEEVVMCTLKDVQNITINSLTNSICFESGYIHYLATSGDASHLFKFHTKHYVLDEKMDKLFSDIGDTAHVKSFPVDTYREEVVLYVQLKNSTVLALNWQGSDGFKLISLPDKRLDAFDLSKATVIPNYGFLIGNRVVKFNFKLKQLSSPEKSEIQKMLEIKSVFEDLSEKQELATIMDKLLFEQNIVDDIESNKLSNSTEIIVDNLIIHETGDSLVKVGSDQFTFEELQSTYDQVIESVNELEIKVDGVEQKIKQIVDLKSTTENNYFDEVNVIGDFEVKGKLKVENLTIDRLNEIPMNALMDECMRTENTKITGLKSFPTINLIDKNFKVKILNGKRLDEIEFHDDYKDYAGIDLSNVTKLEVAGDLNFTKIFGRNWQELMQNLVFKNQKRFIPGTTVVSGQMTAHYILMGHLNELKYPSDYVVKSGPVAAEVTGIKNFDSIVVTNLINFKFINDVPADEFIYLQKDQNLTNEITLKNLVIYENLQIDGDIVGLPEEDINPDFNLLNSNVIHSHAKFSNLYVTGKVYVENLLNGTEWSELDDLILNDEGNVTVSGTKVFLDSVHFTGGLEVNTGMINGHYMSDFMTLDTEQVLPNLSKVSGNITFEKVSYEELTTLEKKINSNVDEVGTRSCLKKVVVFSEPPIVDEFSASYINKNITGLEFSEQLNSLLKNAHFQHLKVKNLIVDDIQPIFVNNVNYQKFKNRKISKTGYQRILGHVNIKYLEVEKLYTDFINDRTVEEIENTINQINIMYENIFSGKVMVESLNITGNAITRFINDRDLYEDHGVNNIDKYIFKTDAVIENIVVDGLVNGLNFTKKVRDCVLRTENNVVIEGRKKIRKLKTSSLQVVYINDHSADDIISPYKNQTLTGPVKIKGSVKVLQDFHSTGTVNDVSFQEIDGVIRKLNNNVYKLSGDFVIYNHVYVKDLNVSGLVQNQDIKQFFENLIYLHEKEVVVTGTKVFNKSVNFDKGVIIAKKLDDIDLELFYNNAVLTDRPIFIKSSVSFKNDISVENDIIVNSIRANALNNVTLEDLMANAKYLNRPMAIENLTLSNVEFRSDIFVESWNDVRMDTLITLRTDQITPATLMCINATVRDIDIKGTVNGETLMELYTNSFMLSRDQHITGKITFMNNVYVQGDFNSHYINNVDMSKTVTLSGNDPLIGNYVFNHPVAINGDLEVRGKVDGIDIRKWESRAIKNSSPERQIIYGNLTVHGNVRFERDVYGFGSLNTIDMRKLAYDITQENAKAEAFVANERKKLKTECEKLHELSDQINSSVYKFKLFDYLKVLEFDQKIVSVHHFELNNIDYVMVNFETCYLDVYSYSNENFVKASEIIDFGVVKKYVDLSYGDNLYFVTLGKPECGRNSGNLWVLENHQFKHVLDLGNVTDIQGLGNDAFAVVIDEQVQEWSVKDVSENLLDPVNVIPIEDKSVKFFSHDNDTFLASRETIYGLNVSGKARLLEFEEYENPFGTNDLISFLAGFYKREFVLYYDERVSDDYIFICNENMARRKILQTIAAKKPNSFTILNFEGLYETLLIFTENKRTIQIYEYKGVENFKHHSSIKMKLDKLFSFQLRIHPYFVKKHCLAVVQENKLSILVAKMYGEKLDVSNQLNCEAI